MPEVIEATVRRHGNIGNKPYGHVVSAKLGPYVGQDVRITVERVLCPICQSPLQNKTCPTHGKIEKPKEQP